MYFRSKILSPSNNSLISPKTPNKNAHFAQKFALRQTICLFRPKVGVIKRETEKDREKPRYAKIDREIPREKAGDTER